MFLDETSHFNTFQQQKTQLEKPYGNIDQTALQQETTALLFSQAQKLWLIFFKIQKKY